MIEREPNKNKRPVPKAKHLNEIKSQSTANLLGWKIYYGNIVANRTNVCCMCDGIIELYTCCYKSNLIILISSCSGTMI